MRQKKLKTKKLTNFNEYELNNTLLCTIGITEKTNLTITSLPGYDLAANGFPRSN